MVFAGHQLGGGLLALHDRGPAPLADRAAHGADPRQHGRADQADRQRLRRLQREQRAGDRGRDRSDRSGRRAAIDAGDDHRGRQQGVEGRAPEVGPDRLRDQRGERHQGQGRGGAHRKAACPPVLVHERTQLHGLPTLPARQRSYTNAEGRPLRSSP